MLEVLFQFYLLFNISQDSVFRTPQPPAWMPPASAFSTVLATGVANTVASSVNPALVSCSALHNKVKFMAGNVRVK